MACPAWDVPPPRAVMETPCALARFTVRRPAGGRAQSRHDPSSSNSARRKPGVANHGANLFELGTRPRQIAGYFDVQLPGLTGFDVNKMDISCLFVNDCVGSRRSGHDVKVVVLGELRDLLRTHLIREKIRSMIAVRNEIDRVADPHRPAVVTVGPRKLLNGIIGKIYYRDRVRTTASVMPPHAGFFPWREHVRRYFFISQTAAVRRVRTGKRPRQRQSFRQPAV